MMTDEHEDERVSQSRQSTTRKHHGDEHDANREG